MADKTISQLTTIESVTGGISTNDLMVLEHSGTAYSVSGQTLINYITNAADGHGGISNIAKTGTSGLVDTYTITYADSSTGSFTVTNGAKGNTGETGAASYVYIRYASQIPDSSHPTISTTPNDYMGIAVTTSSTAPTSYTAYEPWFKVVGDAASVEPTPSVLYQIGNSYGEMPTGTWVDISNVGTINGGDYLWSKSTIEFNDNTEVVIYNKSRQGIDGEGMPGTEVPLADSGEGAVGTSTSFAREDHVHPLVSELAVENYSIDNVSVAANDVYGWTKSVAKTGYTPIMVTQRIANATTSGANSSFINVYSCYINGNNAVTNLRNTSSSAAKILIAITVLYVKS